MPPWLTPGENLQVQQNLRVRLDLLELHERKERNVNLWTSSPNPNPTWWTPGQEVRSCGQHARDAGHGELQTDKDTDGAKGVCGKRRPRDAGRLRGRDVSVSCGHLDVFQETPSRLTPRGKVSGNGEFLADQGSHETFVKGFCAAFKARETCIWNWFGPENR